MKYQLIVNGVTIINRGSRKACLSRGRQILVGIDQTYVTTSDALPRKCLHPGSDMKKMMSVWRAETERALLWWPGINGVSVIPCAR